MWLRGPCRGCSSRPGGHRRTVSGGGFPVFDPLLANTVGAFDQFAAGAFSVLDDDDKAGVEGALRMIKVGQARSRGRNYVLDRHLEPLSLENRVTLWVPAAGYEIAQKKKVGHIRGRH